jgi:hypothetical protein
MPIDLDLFMVHMRGRGIVEVLLRGHLWIEKFLGELLEAELRDPAVIRLGRTPFSQKVNLAQALGLVSPVEAKPLRLLNKLRNKLAHDLAGEPSTADLSELQGSLGPVHKTLFDVQLERDPGAGDVRRLEFLIHGVLIALEYHRLRHVYWKENRAVLDAYGIARALETRFGGEPTPDDELKARMNIPDPPQPYDVWVQPRGIEYDDLGRRIEEAESAEGSASGG